MAAARQAELIFHDPFHLSVPDRTERGDERWQTIGLVGSLILLVVHTYVEQNGEEIIRIISARKATKHERERYEEEQ
ncbi:MAG: BrnT family toxin [Sphingomicrobium sp.]